MKTLHLILLVLPVIFYYLDALLPKGYIFDPVKLQELSKISIETGNGNTTQVMSNLVALLQEEYGSQHVNGMEMDKWFFKYVLRVYSIPFNCSLNHLDFVPARVTNKPTAMPAVQWDPCSSSTHPSLST